MFMYTHADLTDIKSPEIFLNYNCLNYTCHGNM